MIIYVTNRELCRSKFCEETGTIGRGEAGRHDILREKDLTVAEYETLAERANKICKKCGVPLIVNQFAAVAEKLKIPHVQMPMENLRTERGILENFLSTGASVHSVDEAVEAEKLGATWLIAGHIFATSSKKGIPPRCVF